MESSLVFTLCIDPEYNREHLNLKPSIAEYTLSAKETLALANFIGAYPKVRIEYDDDNYTLTVRAMYAHGEVTKAGVGTEAELYD